MRRSTLLLTVLLAASCATVHADTIRFRYHALVINPGQPDSVLITSYGDTLGDLGMVTINGLATKVDSVIGARPFAFTKVPGSDNARQHAVGRASALFTGDGPCRVLIKFDTSIIPDGARVTRAVLTWPAAGVGAQSGCTGTACSVLCVPLTSWRPWNDCLTVASEDGGHRAWVLAGADANDPPNWNAYVSDGSHDWTTGGGSTDRYFLSDPANAADRWAAPVSVCFMPASESTRPLEFDVTSTFAMAAAASAADPSHCGWMIRIATETSAVNALSLADHRSTTAGTSPWLSVAYIDTTHARTVPLQLGLGGIKPAPMYRDTLPRDTSGRIAFISDTHGCPDDCGTPMSEWYHFRTMLHALCHLTPKPTAIFHGGDICVRTSCALDSVAAMEQICTNHGVEFYPALGNWEGREGGTPTIWSYAQAHLPELANSTYYAVDLGFAKVLVLNDNVGWNDGFPLFAPAYTGLRGDSLCDRTEQQWCWVKRELANAREGQAKIMVAHKSLFGLYTGRRNLRDLGPPLEVWNKRGAADSLAALAQRGGAWMWLTGHQHAYTCSAPLVIDLPGDTVYARAASGTTVSLAETDSAVVYLTAGFPWIYWDDPNAAMIAHGWARRWGTTPRAAGSDSTRAVVVDILGDWWREQLIDSHGACYDTLLVKRGD